jgi:hypothetical protein
MILGVLATSQPRKVHDYDAPFFQGAKATILDRGADPSARIHAMRELVTRNAAQARELIAGTLHDPNLQVQRSAAEWLVAYGDRRGSEWEARCLENPGCPEIAYHAVRLLGNSKDPRYAVVIRTRVLRAFRSGRMQGGAWDGSANDRAMLKYGVIALARMGHPEDVDLVLEVVKARPSGDFLEALAYIDDRRSRNILWSAYRSLSGVPTCSRAGLGVPALIPLSRLGEEKAADAVKDILRGTGTPPDPWENTFPSLCADRAQAFRALRPRDARTFAETVLEIAGQTPEGPGTFEAWQALGMMRPEGFGPRVLRLAISRTRWRLVSHDVLNTVVLALDPDLNDEFWAAYDDAQVVPAQLGKRSQINEGLGYLLFSGSGQWTGD